MEAVTHTLRRIAPPEKEQPDLIDRQSVSDSMDLQQVGQAICRLQSQGQGHVKMAYRSSRSN